MWLGMVAGFIINSMILSVSAYFLYQTDVQVFHKQTEGLFDSLGIFVLVYFIPINTFINFVILKVVKIDSPFLFRGNRDK
ncbi:hypothetical protein J2S19_001435 [Metabacillus malikii]|uniref:Uncharacterized protein n=2 Tax=Metabacillus malikii TaxID=1504265 RepID=A0ABT9ZD55_9BACI|nr:hypothetical protein [Metabacillus malikii]